VSEQQLTTLLPVLGTAAFRRDDDGTFIALAPMPEWLQRLTSDTTFPFLGHILEEAAAFWRRRTPGLAEWGPCAEVDEQGHEYHYSVTAIVDRSGEYLVFQIDRGADRMREVLQKVRSEALSAETDAASYRAVAARLGRTNQELKELLKELVQADLTPAQLSVVNKLSTKCIALMAGVWELVRATTIPRA
jgi:hypothetical protein